jgi:hypothetical protein
VNQHTFKWISVLSLIFITFWGRQTVSAEMVAVTIKSLEGKVEVKKPGSTAWIPAKPAQKLRNDELLRTAEKAKSLLYYDDGSIVIVREKSQVTVMEAQPNPKKLLPNYLTVFSGQVFYKTRETLPNFYIDKIYTPTAIISIKGTSLSVAVDSQNGQTEVMVLSGKVLVKNILMSEEYFVRAGYRTVVSLNTPPQKPALLSATDREKLKQWTGAENTMGELPSAEPAAAKPQDRIVVVKFLDNSGFVGKQDIGSILAKALTEALRGSVKSDVTFYPDNTKDAEEIGKIEKAKLVITGDITGLDISRQGQLVNTNSTITDFYKGTVDLVLFLVNTDNHQLVKTIRVSEAVAGDDRAASDWKILDRYSYSANGDSDSSQNSTVGKTLDKALEKASKEIGDFLIY